MASAPREARRSRGTCPILRGRDDELVRLGDDLSLVRGGLGRVTILEGHVGYGKTRLVQEAASIAERLGFRVGRWHAQPIETPHRFAALFAALFDGGEPPLIRDGASCMRHAARAERIWLLKDLEHALRSAAADGPLLIAFDDAQQSDSESIWMIQALADRLWEIPIAWLIACRTNPCSRGFAHAVGELRAHGAHSIELEPLTDQAVTAVVRDVLGAAADDHALAVADRANGNPSLLLDLINGLREEEQATLPDGLAQSPQPGVPARLETTMRRRTDRLSTEAREAVAAAAAFDQSFAAGDLAAVLNTNASSLSHAIAELIEADLLGESDRRLEFPNPLTREALRSSLPAAVLCALDRQVAALLLQRGALPAEVAEQLASSSEPGDAHAIVALQQAANSLAISDPSNALRVAERALALITGGGEQRAPLLTDTAIAMHAVEGGAKAYDFAERSLRETTSVASEARLRLAVAAMFTVTPTLRVDAGQRALMLEGLDHGLRARHLSWLVHNLHAAGRSGEAEACLPAARTAAQATGDIAAQLTLALAEAALQITRGNYSGALVLLERASSKTAVDPQDHPRESLAEAMRCEAMVLLDRRDEAALLAADGTAGAERQRQPGALRIFKMWRGRQLLEMGQIEESIAQLRPHFAQGSTEPIATVLDSLGLLSLGKAALHAGELRLTRRVANLATAARESDIAGVAANATWLLALQAANQGDSHRARELLSDGGEPGAAEWAPQEPLDVADEITIAKIGLATGDAHIARQALARTESRVELNPGVESLECVAAHLRGLIDRNPSELSAAAAGFERCSRPLVQAQALEDLAAHRLSENERKPAIEGLDAALRIAVKAGASNDAGRLRGKLRELGERRRVVEAAVLTSGWGSLTQAELKVAVLAAEGMTNRTIAERLFLSPHTISSHLRHVFTKLDINSRVQLAAIAPKSKSEREPGIAA